MKELSYLNKYFLKYKYHLISGILFITLSVIFQIAPALIVRYAINLVTENINIYRSLDGLDLQDSYYSVFAGSIIIYAVLILALALLRGVFLFFVRQTIIAMSRLIEYDLKNEIYSHYQSLPLSFYRRNNTGDLMNRISEDVSKVRMYIGPSIMYGLNLFVLFAILIPYMFTINVTLTLFALIPLPILSISIYYVNNIINKRSEEIQISQSGLSTFAQEAFSGIRVLKSFTKEKDSVKQFTDKSDEYKIKSLKLTKVQALFFPLILGLIGVSTILTVYAGSTQVINGTLTFGNIAEFIIYVNLLTWPVASLGWISSLIQRAAASQKRINEFLKTENNIISTENLKTEIRGEVEFKDVTFVYPDSGITALKKVSFKIEPGQSLAIIGTTGSGKSTIANLISRLYDASEGDVLIDNTDIKKYHLVSLRSQLGYVPQDVFLFSDTIYNNIAFGTIEMNEDRVIEAAKEADVYQNIMDFPEGFNTRVGERGITLSGGQKQRVSIARAISRNPKILMLDDSLSAVDTKTENTILNSMKRIMKGRTSIIISHRVSSAKLADKIIVLDDGEVVEKGTHDELIEFKGMYKELYDKQTPSEEKVS
ncbi:ABC transporter ATP-binding protein/permease [Fulvivirga maritima]|uniref:ABC transporter ATP-binding protein n=1 Tax=Fulvivirga maritima TaxID=2904247 RepID=UPI001F2567DA|nr:ABC transporter ATP-binding protein [Fulvivirga maritima]UII28224.1 ABC transporter ATP-binding protein/permease [Fulvivirga maritima]